MESFWKIQTGSLGPEEGYILFLFGRVLFWLWSESTNFHTLSLNRVLLPLTFMLKTSAFTIRHYVFIEKTCITCYLKTRNKEWKSSFFKVWEWGMRFGLWASGSLSSLVFVSFLGGSGGQGLSGAGREGLGEAGKGRSTIQRPLIG